MFQCSSCLYNIVIPIACTISAKRVALCSIAIGTNGLLNVESRLRK